MISYVLLTASLICPSTIVLNNTKTWNEIDKQSLSTAKNRCAVLFPRSPCLKIFTKKKEDVYEALCSEKKEQGT